MTGANQRANSIISTIDNPPRLHRLESSASSYQERKSMKKPKKEKLRTSLDTHSHSSAISSPRLLWQDDTRVAFSYRESQTGEKRECVLSAEEFLRRFLQHVLPKRFRRVRTYGWQSPAAKARRSLVHALLGWHSSTQSMSCTKNESSPAAGRHRPVQIMCAKCSKPMKRIGSLARAPRSSLCIRAP